MTASQLKLRKREDRRSSMTSRMGPETEKMFTILSAKDWDHRRPSLNPFMRRLMKDKGMSRAYELVRSELRHGEGTVTDNGLVQFLTQGYICKTMDERPGGFTFFMFRPIYVDGAHNPRLVEQQIHETFRDAKLSEEIVKFYAKMNFHIPTSFADFMVQLETCYQTLELFISQRGIASVGYCLAYKIMSADTRRYRPLFAADPSLGVKVGRFLDNVFQNFCSDLADFSFDRDPIRSARRRLEYRFQDQITSFFNGIRNGVVPVVLLPQSPTSPPRGNGAGHESGGGHIGTKSKSTKTKGKAEPNPEAKPEWCIPAGRKFGDFFSPAKSELKPNCTGWPSFPHRDSKLDRPMWGSKPPGNAQRDVAMPTFSPLKCSPRPRKKSRQESKRSSTTDLNGRRLALTL
jgi:hypothetical protein